MTQFFSKHLSPPWVGIDNAIGSLTREPGEAEMIGMQEVLFIFLGLVCTIVSWIKLRPAYSVWMTGNWLMFVSRELCAQRAALHADDVSDLHFLLDARGAASVAGGDNGLVDPVSFVLCEPVCLGTLGVLRPMSKVQGPKSKVCLTVADFGLWTLDFGLWTLDFGLWTLDFGLWTLDLGLWTISFSPGCT